MSQDQEKGRENQQTEVREGQSRGSERNRTDSSRKRTFVRLLVEEENERREREWVIQCGVREREQLTNKCSVRRMGECLWGSKEARGRRSKRRREEGGQRERGKKRRRRRRESEAREKEKSKRQREGERRARRRQREKKRRARKRRRREQTEHLFVCLSSN